jgi:hypothetical protein
MVNEQILEICHCDTFSAVRRDSKWPDYVHNVTWLSIRKTEDDEWSQAHLHGRPCIPNHPSIRWNEVQVQALLWLEFAVR